MLEEVRLRQQKIVKPDDIKRFDQNPDNEKPQKELPISESTLYSINPADSRPNLRSGIRASQLKNKKINSSKAMVHPLICSAIIPLFYLPTEVLY